MLSSCPSTFKFFDILLKYAQYHFENKLWNQNDMLEYLRTGCFSKNVTFNAIEAFQQSQEYHGSDVWNTNKEFGRDYGSRQNAMINRSNVTFFGTLHTHRWFIVEIEKALSLKRHW